ncbi:hypothetical protein TNCV_1015321 [Trichonephila clavipes]|uniref:Uncharacterized protein n=1 Tax=Trichonephila clavipes TaxID=2585209 RepID=A0A8X7BA22_TRICX|nr:hypothetical protein TNCV_1015321 [Trichonephila clavipes]
MDVCKFMMPVWHGDTRNIHQAASLFQRLVEVEERCPSPLQDVLPQNEGGTEPNHTVTCIVLKAVDNNRR